MKKLVVILSSMVLVSFMAFAASAAPVISVDGGYLFGSYKGDTGYALESKANGFVISAAADGIVETIPVGAALNLISLSQSAFKIEGVTVPDGVVESSIVRTDFLASYALPLEGVKVKALAGYGLATQKLNMDLGSYGYTNGTIKCGGLLAGASASFSPMENLTAEGTFIYGFGMKVKTEYDISGVPGTEEGNGSSTLLKVAASYKVMDNIFVEGGYQTLGVKYKLDGAPSDCDEDWGGLFFGARAQF